MNPLLYSIKWAAQIFTEPDGNGGKASFARVFGGFVILVIVKMAWIGKPVPEPLMTIFWVLVGYQFLSKALGPDGIKSIFNRSAPLAPPPPEPTKPAS